MSIFSNTVFKSTVYVVDETRKLYRGGLHKHHTRRVEDDYERESSADLLKNIIFGEEDDILALLFLMY